MILRIKQKNTVSEAVLEPGLFWLFLCETSAQGGKKTTQKATYRHSFFHPVWVWSLWNRNRFRCPNTDGHTSHYLQIETPKQGSSYTDYKIFLQNDVIYLFSYCILPLQGSVPFTSSAALLVSLSLAKSFQTVGKNKTYSYECATNEFDRKESSRAPHRPSLNHPHLGD